jgi:DNA polymerase elongation subunit (family B)
MTFDIEVEMESGLPDTEKAENELTAIGLQDNITNQYWVLIMDKKGKMVERKTDKAIILPFRDERDMCMKFLELYEGIAPDILTGWNIDNFDIPYLFNRMKRILGESQAKRLSPIGQAFYSPYRQRWFFAGVSCLDYLSLYKKFNYKIR